MSCWNPGPVRSDGPEVQEQGLDLFLQVGLQEAQAGLSLMSSTFPRWPERSQRGGTGLQGFVDLGAVQHEDEVVEVPQSRLPGDEVPLLGQVCGGSQSQCGVDHPGSEQTKLIHHLLTLRTCTRTSRARVERCLSPYLARLNASSMIWALFMTGTAWEKPQVTRPSSAVSQTVLRLSSAVSQTKRRYQNISAPVK